MTEFLKVIRDRRDVESSSSRGHVSILTGQVTVRSGKGSKLILNDLRAAGELRVQLTDLDGTLIPGFTFDDCVPFRADESTIEVEWLAAANKTERKPGLVDLSRLDGRTVCIQILADEHNPKCRCTTVISGEPLPLRIGPGPHLFVDDVFVAKSENLAYTTTHPERCDTPLIEGATNRNSQIVSRDRIAPGAVMHDTETSLFRMWNWKAGNSVRSELVHRTSNNPSCWPERGETVFCFDGFGSKLIDSSPYCDDELRRFKFAYFNYEPPMGTCVAFSPDGIEWEPYAANPVLPFYPIGDPQWANGVGDITDPFWDSINRQYAAFVKMPSASAQEFGVQSRTVKQGLGIRLTALTTSTDFMHWTRPRRVFIPDELDEGVTEFYGAEVLPRKNILIAFVRILRDDVAAEPGGPIEGIGYTTIATSRDGKSWQRHRDVFLDRSSMAGAFDRAFAWIYATLEWQDRVYLYYAAYNEGHKTGQRSIGLASLPRDRFVGLESRGSMEGHLVTPLLIHTGQQMDSLWVNVNARGGELRVQVRDARNRVIDGLSFNDSKAVISDSLAHQVEYPTDLRALQGLPFRLEFALRDATLFSFSLGGSHSER